MLEIKRLIVGQLKTNCYLVIDEAKSVVIIDPGDDADYIMRIISDLQAKPSAIVATHGHFDHILAATELKLNYKIPFLMHKADEFLLKRMRSSAKHFAGIKADLPPKVDRYLEDKEKLVIDHLSFDTIHSPGHTPGSISLYEKRQNILFCGDLIFSGGTGGRVDFAYSSRQDLEASVEKILNLPADTTVLSGHGERTTIKKLKLYKLV